MSDWEIIRQNLAMLASKEVRDTAMTESVGGNAGPGCYVLNLGVSEEGRIVYAGNDPGKTNASIRVFTSAFFRGVKQLDELVIDVYTGADDKVRRMVATSAWLWNLYREGKEKAFLDRFIDGELEWPALIELLRAKYPQLAPELE